MKKDKNADSGEHNAQTGDDIKKGLPIKNKMTEQSQNAAQEPGLNQEKTTRDDLLPSDGDNLTN